MSRPIWLKSPLAHQGSRLYFAAPFGLGGRDRVRSGKHGDPGGLAAVVLIVAVVIILLLGIRETFAPVSSLRAISLDPRLLPDYAVRTVLRMLAAMMASLVFTLVYGTLAARSRRAEAVLIPLLDILQSVPVLGYLSFTAAFFVKLAPHWVMGLELASIFAIFTS